jgi:lysine-N-methylase
VPSPDAITARYLTRFKCLGTACEENCCQGWQVQIDRRHYQIMKAAMDGSRAEREAFRGGVQRNHTDERDDGRYAWIRLDREKQSCPFLSPKKLCTVQDRYGEGALPDICATYPRLVSKFGDRLEVWGTLSCPEMARPCLLEDDALEIVDAVAAEISPRTEPTTAVVGTPTPYQRLLDDMRAAVFQLLSMRDFPMGTRLFLVSYLGKQTAEIFNKSSTRVDEARLAEIIGHVASPDNVALWDAELSRLPAPDALTAKLVTQMLRERLKVPMGSFRVLVDKILATYGDVEGVALDESGAPTISVSDLWTAYSTRRKFWLEHLSDRVDLYFENYTKNFWLREWFVTSPDLLAHSQRLLVRVAVLRFLLFGHPWLKEAMSLEDPAARREVLDRAAVDIFYKFSRAIEHEGSFLDLLAARLVEQGMNTFAHATLLALM